MRQYGVGQSNVKVQPKGYMQQLDASQNSRRSDLSLGNTEYSYNFNKTKNNLANMQQNASVHVYTQSKQDKGQLSTMTNNMVIVMDEKSV